jgi:hypothetical protein
VLVSALRVVDLPPPPPAAAAIAPEGPAAAPAADSGRRGGVGGEATVPSERAVADVLADVCFAAGVPEGLPPAAAVADAAKRAGPAYTAALRRRSAQQPPETTSLLGLRAQLLLLAHVYGIPTAIADAPAPVVLVESAPDSAATAAAAGASSVSAIVAAAADAPASAAPPSAEWVFEVETRSGDAAFLGALFAPFALPAPFDPSSDDLGLLSEALAGLALKEDAEASAPIFASAHWLNFVGGLLLDLPGAFRANATAASAGSFEGPAPRLRALTLGLAALRSHPTAAGPGAVTKPGTTSGAADAATAAVLPAWRKLREERGRLGLSRAVC